MEVVNRHELESWGSFLLCKPCGRRFDTRMDAENCCACEGSFFWETMKKGVEPMLAKKALAVRAGLDPRKIKADTFTCAELDEMAMALEAG